MKQETRLRLKLNAKRATDWLNFPQAIARTLFKRSGYTVYRGSLRGLRVLSPYQPLYGVGTESRYQSLIRDVENRSLEITKYAQNGASLLDIGCMNGYMTFSLAPNYRMAIGLDSSLCSIQISRMLQIRNAIPNTSFILWDITPDNINEVPTADTVLFLSVFHHWVNRFGQEPAMQMLRILSSKAIKQLFFETGQPEEVNNSWHKRLSFMAPDPEQWISTTLRDVGFDSVRTLTRTPGYLDGPPRFLVLAEKSPTG